MQITTVHKLQHAWDSFIKALQLVWRHALTLIVVGMMFHVVRFSTANWRNIIITLFVTHLLDWAKMKIKLKFINGSSNYHQSSSITSFTQDNYWNSSIVGTSAYLSNLGRS